MVDKKNDGISYERLAREVFARMEPLRSVGAKVEHDVILRGKSGVDYQIDVVITIAAGPVRSVTIIQCKDWEARVKKSDVGAFHAVMNDIPGNPSGFFVARTGYQSGAIEYARHHGIKLLELRESRDQDWEGFVKTVGITIQFRIPSYSVTPVVDTDWARERMVAAGIESPTGTQFQFIADPDEAVFESGRPFKVEDLLPAQLPPPGEPEVVHLDFKGDGLLLKVDDFVIPHVRCVAMDVAISVETMVQPLEIRLDEYVKYHFRDVLSGESSFLGEDGGPPTRR